MIDPITEIENFNFDDWLFAVKEGELKEIEICENTQNPIFSAFFNIMIKDFYKYIKIENILNQLQEQYNELIKLSKKDNEQITKNLQKQIYFTKTLRIYVTEIQKQAEYLRFFLHLQKQVNSKKIK
uniref:Uncharacterized protein n=1 Tax=Parietochloris pseudoalveolaris TaxID=3102 RepID=A0A097KLK3_9CHLO|nr:hypothetical protein [Parietochloris pseudoalveolaris]AIT94064.1 hypothetical protein [Parietochloris pseudoalveolaris]